MQNRSFSSVRWTAMLSVAVAAGTALGAEEQHPFGPNDPYRPYDQVAAHPAEPGVSGEGLFLNADLGVSLMQDTSSIKADPGVRFSIGPGYTLHSSELFEVGAQFETGFIYDRVKREQTVLTLPTTTRFVRETGDYYQVPFLADIVYAFHVQPNLVPFLGFGGGLVCRDISSASLPDRRSADPAFQAMAGLRFRLNEQHELGFGYKFLAVFPSGSDILTHSLSATWVFHF